MLSESTSIAVNEARRSAHWFSGHKLVALFEGSKAALMAVVALGCLSLLHRDIHALAVRCLVALHFNPASHYPQLLLHAARHLTDGWLWALAFAMAADSILRFTEAYGLWKQRRWAEWLAVISAGIYLPFEIYELAIGFNWVKLSAFTLNLAIILYLGRALMVRHVGRNSGSARASSSRSAG